MSVKKLERKPKPAVVEEPKDTEAIEAPDAEAVTETAEAEDIAEKAAAANEEAAETAETSDAESADEPEEEEELKSGKTGRKPLYQVSYKRDDEVIEAFITFDYRVVHPKVLLRSILYGIVFVTFGVVASSTVFSIICFLLAMLCFGLVIFRKRISLNMTKKDDQDYQNGVVYTYNFTENGARMLRNNKPEVYAKSYKNSVTAFFGDQTFYYIALTSNDLFVLPKNKFTIGDPEEFEKFIIKKTGREMRWIPYGIKGVLNSLKNFSQQPVIDTQGWRDIINHQREKRSVAKNAEQSAENKKNASVKPKSLKDKNKK
jgi:hypothetical protein